MQKTLRSHYLQFTFGTFTLLFHHFLICNLAPISPCPSSQMSPCPRLFHMFQLGLLESKPNLYKKFKNSKQLSK